MLAPALGLPDVTENEDIANRGSYSGIRALEETCGTLIQEIRPCGYRVAWLPTHNDSCDLTGKGQR